VILYEITDYAVVLESAQGLFTCDAAQRLDRQTKTCQQDQQTRKNKTSHRANLASAETAKATRNHIQQTPARHCSAALLRSLTKHFTLTSLTNMTGLGSDTWLEVSEIDEESDLHTRATTFVAAIQWEKLITFASSVRGTPCTLSEKYSLGHFNLVRRLTFSDGVNWVVRLRLPELPSVFGSREAMKAADCMSIEVATMNYLRLNTDIPVPEVFGHDLSADNVVGAPYILMSYIHGTVAADFQEAQDCGNGVFGSPEQDRRFWSQMAKIHAQLAGLTFDKIGSLCQDGDRFTIGPEIETGEGPWNTPKEYYEAILRHRMDVANTDAPSEVRDSDSFTFPSKFMELMQSFESPKSGPFGLANRDFGAHNVLVDNQFNVVGLIDFDGVMAAPSAVVAQLPGFMGLSRPVPGFVETREFAVKRLKESAHLLPRYTELVQAAVAGQEVSTGKKDISGLAEMLVSDAASMVQGLNEFGQHRDLVNDRWSAAYAVLLQKKQGKSAAMED
jgi:hypothetical protein